MVGRVGMGEGMVGEMIGGETIEEEGRMIGILEGGRIGTGRIETETGEREYVAWMEETRVSMVGKEEKGGIQD